MVNTVPTLHVAPTPRIHVEAATLDAGCDLLVYNHPGLVAMVLNAKAPAWAIAEALADYGRHALEAGVWQRTAIPREPVTAKSRNR